MRTVDEFSLTTSLLKKFYLNKISVSEKSQDLTKILKKHPKLVVALNHGPMAGALAGLVGIADMLQKHGGSSRTPFGITWRTFYQLPVSKQIFTYLTQVDRGLSFDDASSLLSDSGFTDCFIMPEGELCNFGNGLDIQPFLSPRFIELAIQNDIPILVVTHQGSEKWAWPMTIKDQYKSLFSWLPQNMKAVFDKSSIISIPKPFKQKLNLTISFYLYQPKLTKADLKKDKEARLEQLTAESNHVRERMQRMVMQLQTES
mgnify:CR=1 FL=1